MNVNGQVGRRKRIKIYLVVENAVFSTDESSGIKIRKTLFTNCNNLVMAAKLCIHPLVNKDIT